ncbi:hypothetical protein HDV05_004918 [Chytridiales sp. JEL 0842]|nr:hypothetical protein HDV05_004918 [Chytridiales sp. JEL 0842]
MNVQNVPVRVAVRVRPPAEKNSRRLSLSVVPSNNAILVGKDRDGGSNPQNENGASFLNNTLPQLAGPGGGVVNGNKRGFTFDIVYGQESSQKQLYNSSCASLVDQFVDGFNVTIFAYGQTSSGKTYTMGSNNNATTPDAQCGIIPRVIRQVMKLIQVKRKMDPKIEYSIRCVFLEIYQEQVRDLLMPDIDPKDIAIREDRTGAITISGIHEQPVQTTDDLFRCLEAGGIERTTGDTRMHMHSSRSHAIFTILLEQRLNPAAVTGMRTDEEEFGVPSSGSRGALLRVSKLHLVDLAGSERLKRTGAEGVRFKESVKINSGLLALGNVISVLGGDANEKAVAGGKDGANVHVPYRDSKLTRLLQDSLGGNSKTLMIACVSPSEDDYDETLNTLKYADRAKKIQNKPVINTVDIQAAKLASMQEKIDSLEKQLKSQEASSAPKDKTLKPMSAGDGDILARVMDMTDMDNDQWTTYFVEELKNRTIRGTNAIKALKAANEENERLANRVSSLEERYTKQARLEAERIQRLFDQIQDDNIALRNTCDHIASDIDVLVDSIIAIDNDKEIGREVFERLLEVVAKHRPDEPEIKGIDSNASSGQAIVERLQRKNKQLEDELFEAEQKRSQIVAELEDAKNKLLQDDTIFEGKLSLISELERSNADLLSEIEDLRKQLKAAKRQSPKQSLYDANTQTDHIEPMRTPTIAVSLLGTAGLSAGNLAMRLSAQNRKIEADMDADLSRATIDGMSILEVEGDEGVDVAAAVHQADIVGGGHDVETEHFPVHVSEKKPEEEYQVRATRETPEIENDPEATITFVSASRDQLIADLNAANKAKVDLHRELNLKNKEMDKLKHQHTEKIQRMERDLDATGREITRLKSDIEELQNSKEKLKEEHDRKLKSLEAQLAKGKNKLKEQEKSLKDKEQSDKKLTEYQQEVDKLNVALANAKKKSKEDMEKLTELENRRVKEVAALTRAREEDAKKARQLEIAAEMARKRLDRKTEEVAMLSKKMKDGAALAAATGSSKGAKSDRSRSTAREMGIRSDSVGPTEVEKTEVSAAHTRVPEEVDQEIARFRHYHGINVQLRDLKRKMEELGAEIHDLESQLTSKDEEDDLTKAKISDLRRERKAVGRQILELREERKAAEAILESAKSSNSSPRAAKVDHEEPDTIDYEGLRIEFDGNPDMLELLRHLQATSRQEARAMVVGCLRELADAKHSEEAKAASDQTTKEKLLEVQQKMEKVIRAYEKKISKLKTEYETKLAEASPLNMKLPAAELQEHSAQTESWAIIFTEPLARMEKEMLYYKHANKELKAKLREMTAASHKLTKMDGPKGSMQILGSRPNSTASKNARDIPADIAPAAM